jgi:signal transduction histidine kinase
LLLHSVRPPDETQRQIEQPLNQTAEVPARGRYAALWVALTCVTAVLVLVPSLPVAIYESRLSIAVGSVSGVIGLALLQLGLLRFRVLRRPIDLYAGLGFGVLALSNMFAVWVRLPTGAGDPPLEPGAYFLLLARAMAAALFLYGLASSQGSPGGSAWRWPGVALASATTLAVAALWILFGRTDALPPLLDPSARQLLASREPIMLMLPGQQPLLMLANAALAVALLISAIGYTAEGHRLGDPHIASLAAALILIFFGQAHAMLFPSLPTDYVATGDAFRLVAYGLLLSSAMWRTAQDFAATATHKERLRLSRELHDGLAQQLAMLRLRLGRVAGVTTVSDRRSRDLEVAQRVLESASREARRAIADLRSERVPWQEFEQALQALSAEFSLIHDLDARVWTRPSDLRLDSQLQVDVLRILQEAFSNSARHGQAKQIDAIVTPEGDALRVTVSDHGRGFDPAQAHSGVGLRSMAERAERRRGRLVVDSMPGHGTRIEVRLPLSAPGEGAL